MAVQYAAYLQLYLSTEIKKKMKNNLENQIHFIAIIGMLTFKALKTAESQGWSTFTKVHFVLFLSYIQSIVLPVLPHDKIVTFLENSRTPKRILSRDALNAVC